jgi:hypothetical protein
VICARARLHLLHRGAHHWRICNTQRR